MDDERGRELRAAIGRTGDEGIDGMINEDRLGLDVVYVQAKRWTTTIGRPDIQQFAGALAGKRARKGLFITTPESSAAGRAYVGSTEQKIALISGDQLAAFMFKHNVGVARASIYEVKKVVGQWIPEPAAAAWPRRALRAHRGLPVLGGLHHD